MTPLRERATPAIAALFVATLLFGRQIASWGTLRNRYHYLWQRSDGLALIAVVLVLAVILFALGTALRRIEWTRRRRWHELALMVGLLAAVCSEVAPLAHDWGPLQGMALWIAAGGLLWWAWPRWTDRLSAFARGACLMMSPLVPILFGQILLWRPWDVTEYATAAAPSSTRTGPPLALLVVFDEWSWFRTAPSGTPGPEFKNVHRLMDRALLVREARSPSFSTRISMPRLLYQQRGHVVIGNGRAEWEADSVRRPAPQVPDLFDRMRRLGYRSELLGFYLPYRALFGPDGADRIVSYSHAAKGHSVVDQVVLFAENNLQYWTDPVSQWLSPRIQARQYSENWRDINYLLAQRVLQAIDSVPDHMFMVAHLPLPHYPFIFNGDGSYRGPFKGDRRDGTPADYERNLLFTDKVLGDILDALERSGRFDRTLLVVTSDHAWRKEPDSTILAQPDEPHRVPLLIKWPGQAQPLISDEPFCNLGLGSVLEAALSAPPAASSLTDSLWHAVSEEGRALSCRE